MLKLYKNMGAKMPRKKIIIDRSKWRTGDDGENATGKGMTQLINKQGYKCCLGFIAQQAGPRQALKEIGEPCDCQKHVPHLTETDEYDNFENTELASDAININDDEDTTPRQKEKELRTLFKDSPYQLVFEGEYTK